MVNAVTCNGVVTNGQPTKPSGAWVRKAEDKQPIVDLSKVKETFVHTSKQFCIPDPPSMEGKGPEALNRSMELHNDWKASTNAAACQAAEPASNIKSFLQSCLKLIRDENAQLEV